MSAKSHSQLRNFLFTPAILVFTLLISAAASAQSETDQEQALVQELKGEQSHKGHSTEDAPVWKPFMATLMKCEPTCFPVNYHAWRDTGGESCHDEGRALDVFGFKCSGKTYWANTRKFADIVACFRKTGMKVLHNQEDHYDHGHFSIRCHGGTHWLDRTDLDIR